MDKLAYNLKRIRKSLKLTQQEMADSIEEKRSTYATYESEIVAPASVVDKIHRIHGIDYSEFSKDVPLALLKLLSKVPLMQGEVLRTAIAQSDFTQQSFADAMGFSREYLLRIMKDDVLPDGIAAKASALLGTTEEVLFAPKSDNTAAAAEGQPPPYGGKNIMWVPLVSQFAYGSYLQGYADPEYLEGLETVPWLVDDKTYKGRYMSFEMRGDSMNSGDPATALLPGDKLLGRELPRDYWRSKLHLVKWNKWIVVHREAGVVVKNIAKHDVERGVITLHSFNPVFDDFELRLDDVLELYNVIKWQRE